MEPLHFLFVTFEGGGNVPPAFSVARRLRERGHRLSFLGQPAQQAAVHALGASFRALPAPDWSADAEGEEVQVLFPLLFGSAVADCVFESLERDAPDVLVIDCMMMSALSAAERSGLPYVALVHVLYRAFTEGVIQEGQHTLGELLSLGLNLLNPTREHLGLPPVTAPAEMLERTDIALVTSSAHLNRVLTNEPANVRYVGAIRDEPPVKGGPSSWWTHGDERPRVLIAFSSTNQQQQETLCRVRDALSELPVQGIVTVGHMMNPNVVTPSANVAVHRFIAHDQVLPGCDLVMTHGGLGTVQAALAHGVPLLCMPMGRDQGDTAARVEALGAGLTLNSDASVGDIRAAVEGMLRTSTYQDAARRLALGMVEEDGLQAAVDVLEKLVVLQDSVG